MVLKTIGPDSGLVGSNPTPSASGAARAAPVMSSGFCVLKRRDSNRQPQPRTHNPHGEVAERSKALAC